MRILSLGAGVQSSTLLMMSQRGEVDRLDCAIFADTGWEPAAVYDHLRRLEESTDIPILRVSAGDLRADTLAGIRAMDGRAFFDIPAFTADRGISGRQCTRKYKIEPIKAAARQLAGGGKLPAGAIEQWIGISRDEAHRMKPARVRYIVNRWPLIELRMSRGDCLAWWERHYPGLTPPKSACLGCPFHSNRTWVDLYRRGGPEWADTVAVDERLREPGYPGGKNLDSGAYLHSSCRPLREVIPQLAAAADLQPELDGFGNECEGHCGV